MKKTLFFAIALVAGVLAFTSCNKKDKNEPSNPDEINIKDYVGSMWRVDSAYTDDGNAMTGMYVAFKITSASTFQLLGEEGSVSFSVEDHKVTTSPFGEQMILTVVKADKDVIHMETSTDAYDEYGQVDGTTTLRISLSRIPESNGEKVALTAENIIGVWKADYYYESGVYTSGTPWSRYLISRNFNGLDIYEFKADGSLVFENLLDKWVSGEYYEQVGGFWRIEEERLIIATRYPGDTSTEVQEYEVNDVIELTTNIMYLRNYFTTTTTNMYFSKIQ